MTAVSEELRLIELYVRVWPSPGWGEGILRTVSEVVTPNLEGAVPSHLPVLPLKSTVVFPRIFIPLSVGRRRSLQLLDDLPGAERHIAVATQLDETAEEVGFNDLHHIGAMVRVQHMLKL